MRRGEGGRERRRLLIVQALNLLLKFPAPRELFLKPVDCLGVIRTVCPPSRGKSAFGYELLESNIMTKIIILD